MTPRLSRWGRGAATFATLLLLTGGGRESPSAPLPPAMAPGQPLPRELVAALTKAGATVGWMKDDEGWLLFRQGVEGKPGEVPAFHFGKWTGGAVGQLPQPQRAFGLSLRGPQVTDAGLVELAGLKGLQMLDLTGTQVTDAGLRELAGLKGLHTLELGGTQVTDAGMKGLAGLKGLQSLHLAGTRVTDAGLKELSALKALQMLDLQTTRVTDAGLRELAALTGLQTLVLFNTKVMGAGLKELAALKGLKQLGLSNTQVTDAGAAELQEALPALTIMR